MDNDGYASYSKVIAVAACNDRGTQSVYSDFGAAVWCAFPSSDLEHAPFNHLAPLTPGIWTTDRRGAQGYNSGIAADGDTVGNFTNSFGGTSSACPGAAAVAALVLSVNPNLKGAEVKDLFRRACDRIDPQSGEYDAGGHSPKYGYGRLNARTAVELAQPQPRSGTTISRTFNAPIPDLQTVAFPLSIPDATPIESLTVGINLKHTYIGDLLITLRPPNSVGVGPVVLHDRAGGAAKDLRKLYDAMTTPALQNVKGKNCKGVWTSRSRTRRPGIPARCWSSPWRSSFPQRNRFRAHRAAGFEEIGIAAPGGPGNSARISRFTSGRSSRTGAYTAAGSQVPTIDVWAAPARD